MVGQRSVGYRLTEQAKVFGGDVLTATDIGVAAGLVDIGDRRQVETVPPSLTQAAIGYMAQLIEESVDRIKTDAGDMKLLAVGGGAFLVPECLAGVSEVIQVPNGGVANAVGAAIAQVSGEVDQVFTHIGRESAIARATEMARDQALEAGAAADTLEVVDIEDIPIANIPGDARRVHVRVTGQISDHPER